MGNTLTAKGTIRMMNASSVKGSDMGMLSGSKGIPDMHGLHLIANLNTTHTLNTFIVITNQRIAFFPRQFLFRIVILFIQLRIQRKVDAKILQLTISASHTGGTISVVLAHNQFQIGT